MYKKRKITDEVPCAIEAVSRTSKLLESQVVFGHQTPAGVYHLMVCIKIVEKIIVSL